MINQNSLKFFLKLYNKTKELKDIFIGLKPFLTLTKPKSKPLGKLYFITFYVTDNNLFVTIKNSLNKTFFSRSSGFFKYKGREKTSMVAFYHLLRLTVRKLRKLKAVRGVIKTIGYHRAFTHFFFYYYLRFLTINEERIRARRKKTFYFRRFASKSIDELRLKKSKYNRINMSKSIRYEKTLRRKFKIVRLLRTFRKPFNGCRKPKRRVL